MSAELSMGASLSQASVLTKPPLPAIRYSWKNATHHIQQLYITDAAQADAAMSRFTGPCGIDIEWKPTYVRGQPENPVALLQLCNNETILLLHVHRFGYFPQNLQKFLEDPRSIKAGVGVQGDAKKLYKDFSVNVRGCVDLALLARSVDNARWKGRYIDPIGLARLIATYEDRLLEKGKVTRSNWEKNLDPGQLEYASNDCYAGYALYMRFASMIDNLPTKLDPTCFTFDAIRGRLCEPSGMTWSPFNPDYDPGPPPPPKVPKVPKDKSKTASNPAHSLAKDPATPNQHVSSTSTPTSASKPARFSAKDRVTPNQPASSASTRATHSYSSWGRSMQPKPPASNSASVRRSFTLVTASDDNEMKPEPPAKRKRTQSRRRHAPAQS